MYSLTSRVLRARKERKEGNWEFAKENVSFMQDLCDQTFAQRRKTVGEEKQVPGPVFFISTVF